MTSSSSSSSSLSPSLPRGMRAFLFDMDGTLVDSEGQTDDAVASVMKAYGVDGARLDPNDTRGRTWRHIVTTLRALHPRALAHVDESLLERHLVDAWGATVSGMVPLPGARDAVLSASNAARTAVVSSSPRALVERITGTEKLDVRAALGTVVGAEDVANNKPAPDCFLEAAARLYVDPRHCVVFEDARAGLEAARAAGMHAFLVEKCCAELDACRAIADFCFADYTVLPESFWRDLVAPA